MQFSILSRGTYAERGLKPSPKTTWLSACSCFASSRRSPRRSCLCPTASAALATARLRGCLRRDTGPCARLQYQYPAQAVLSLQLEDRARLGSTWRTHCGSIGTCSRVVARQLLMLTARWTGSSHDGQPGSSIWLLVCSGQLGVHTVAHRHVRVVTDNR